MDSSRAIELIARAIIINNDQLLVCQAAGSEHFFLPGGHVEFQEGAEEALLRELREEMGVGATIGEFIGAVEHRFVQKGQERHEVNLLFAATLPEGEVQSVEEHIRFEWVSIAELQQTRLLPESVKQPLCGWLEERTPFWVKSESVL